MDIVILSHIIQVLNYQILLVRSNIACNGFLSYKTFSRFLIDWRKKGYVTMVKDSGQCGASWAFSATGAIEGQNFNATGKLISLSEEQLVDCSGMGCSGGLVDKAFVYINKTGGIEAEGSYPPSPAGECRFDPTKIAAKVSGYIDIKSRDENALQQAVATVGPISVAIDASHSSFQLYRSGSMYSS